MSWAIALTRLWVIIWDMCELCPLLAQADMTFCAAYVRFQLRHCGPARLQRRRSKNDLSGISLPKAATTGPRPGDGIRGSRRGRPYRAAARQSHLVVPVAQRHTVPAAAGPLHCAGPNRNG